jgi:SAM-dependent methyltransferase
VVGVDIDPVLIDAARIDNPGPHYENADLAQLDLSALGEKEPFDAAVCAGNVITYVAPGTETAVLRAIRSVLRPDAIAVFGFHTERYDMREFDAHLHDAGFDLESRFATWDLRPWHAGAEFAVSVLRVPAI